MADQNVDGHPNLKPITSRLRALKKKERNMKVGSKLSLSSVIVVLDQILLAAKQDAESEVSDIRQLIQTKLGSIPTTTDDYEFISDELKKVLSNYDQLIYPTASEPKTEPDQIDSILEASKEEEEQRRTVRDEVVTMISSNTLWTTITAGVGQPVSYHILNMDVQNWLRIGIIQLGLRVLNKHALPKSMDANRVKIERREDTIILPEEQGDGYDVATCFDLIREFASTAITKEEVPPDTGFEYEEFFKTFSPGDDNRVLMDIIHMYFYPLLQAPEERSFFVVDAFTNLEHHYSEWKEDYDWYHHTLCLSGFGGTQFSRARNSIVHLEGKSLSAIEMICKQAQDHGREMCLRVYKFFLQQKYSLDFRGRLSRISNRIKNV